jgi:predicted helicase
MVNNKKYISDYIKNIDKVFREKNKSEHSYRPFLCELMKNLIIEFDVRNEGERIDIGIPDIVIKDNDIPIGFLEAKKVGEDLNNKIYKKQFDKYKEALDNIIFTDHLFFKYYSNNVLIKEIHIGFIDNKKIIENKIEYDNFIDMINEFKEKKYKVIDNSEKLASSMARKAKLLKELIFKSIINNKDKDNSLNTQIEIFKDYLIKDLSEEYFADIFSQTISYSLFAAKLNVKNNNNFSRRDVSELIPESNYFLRKYYHFIIGEEIDDNIKLFIDLFADMFKYVDIIKIKDEFKEKDPFIYFYEIFLDEYDPKLKKEKGVYYTPISVVKFIVNSIDKILKKEFEFDKGIVDNNKINIKYKDENGNFIEKMINRVQILDPATGTGTFISEIIDKIYEYFKENNQGMWNEYCENDLIDRLHAFEYMMASYTIANLKIDMKLKKTGFNIDNSIIKRLGIYLTNTLEEANDTQIKLPLMKWLSEEAIEARSIKNDRPIMVILGNPPYSGESKNNYNDKIYLNYKNINEKNKKPLNDDYVKFIAYGHKLIIDNKIDKGILAYINNNGFIDNKTFFKMRYELLKTFDKIYILNLHGDVEKNKDKNIMENDENIFNIQKGVSINIFIKYNNKKNNEFAQVFYTEIIGERNNKYDYLLKNIDIYNVKFEKVKIIEPYYYFVNKSFTNEDAYNNGFSIKELFRNGIDGIVTSRDEFTINDDKNELINNINEFLQLDNEKARDRFNLGKDSRDWKIEYAKNDLVPNPKNKKEPDFENKIVNIQYCPYDVRYTYYTGNGKGFHSCPRNKIMKDFIIGDNIGIAVCGQSIMEKWQHIAVTKYITSKVYISNKSREGCNVIPLYTYENEHIKERQPNILNYEIIDKISKIINKTWKNEKSNNKDNFSPMDILDYIYAVLYSNKYRKKYNVQLLRNFPKIKFPKNKDEFNSLIVLGEKLRKLHLQELIIENKNINYPINGNDIIINKYIKYENNKIFINENQYFDNVKEEVWNYFIGGYRPAYQWIKAKNDKVLKSKINYINILNSIEETINTQKEIDIIIEV